MTDADSAHPEQQDVKQPMAVIVPLARPALADVHAPVSLQVSSQVSSQVFLQVSFDRRELSQILNIYGRMVSAGEWRDYAMDFLRDRAVFSIFRRTSETPLFTVVKNPALARKQGMYAVISAQGAVLKRGHELSQVLKVFDKGLLKLV